MFFCFLGFGMTCELVAYGIKIGLHSTYFVGPRCFVHFPIFFQLVNNKNNNDSNDKNNINNR